MKSLPPVSPTSRGYVRYELMCSPTHFHIHWNTAVEPVKCTPASSGDDIAVVPMVGASPVTMLITPGGSPASSRICSTYQFDSIAVGAGFQTTLLPMSAGAAGRLPPMAVKLNGDTANTNPSSGRS